MRYFRMSKRRYGCQWLEKFGCQCLGSLTCAQMLMHAIAYGSCTDTVRESALKVDSGRKIPFRTEEIEPASAACRSDVLPTELHPRPPPVLLSVLITIVIRKRPCHHGLLSSDLSVSFRAVSVSLCFYVCVSLSSFLTSSACLSLSVSFSMIMSNFDHT